MMTDLPPRRWLPPEVRDKMLVDLRGKLDQPPKRSRAPFAVAAGVAVLAAGAVVVAAPWQHGDGVDQGAAHISGATGVQSQAQRCVAAAAKIGGFPSGADWKVVVHTALGGFTTLGIKVNGTPVFCQTTDTTVSITRFDATPTYVPGSKTGTLFANRSHMLGIVVDPSWGGIDAYEQGVIDSNRPNENPSYHTGDGMVLWAPEYPSSPLTVVPAHGNNPQPLPPATQQPASVVDQPYSGPPPDRTSERGQFAARCIKAAEALAPAPDPDTWQTGAWVVKGDDALLALRGISGVTFCSGNRLTGHDLFTPWNIDNATVALPTGNRPVVSIRQEMIALGSHDFHDGSIPATTGEQIDYGSVPDNAASMTLTTNRGTTVTAEVRGGTFAANTAKVGGMASDYVTIKSVTVRDANGVVLYQGAPAHN